VLARPRCCRRGDLLVRGPPRRHGDERGRATRPRGGGAQPLGGRDLPAALYTEDLDPDWFGTSYASPQIETITGYPPEAWLEDPDLWLRIVHPDDLEAVLEQERRCVELGEPFSMDVRIVRPDGTVVWVHDETVLIHDEHGEPQYWLGFFHDVTAKKEAEQEMASALELERRSVERLEAIDRMKDAFLTAVSHELRSPLAAIFGSAMTLDQLDDSLTDEDRSGLVVAIIGQTRRLRTLVEDLLDLDRLRHGVAVARRQEVDLGVVVRDVVEATGLADRRDVVMELSELAIAIDRPMVERIVENLLTNAERYTPPGATVWVSVAPTGDGAEILVEDDGPGIPAEVRPYLFEPFHQGPNALSHSPGVGVGLSLVARFAELHGGRVWVDERPGGGASFRVTLAHADRRAGREPNGQLPA
jgi:PAS domain S-box-containing protein